MVGSGLIYVNSTDKILAFFLQLHVGEHMLKSCVSCGIDYREEKLTTCSVWCICGTHH